MSSNDVKYSKDDEQVKEAPFLISWRFALSIIGFLGFVHVYAQRVGMSVAIVCMVNQTALQLQKMSDDAVPILNGSDIYADDTVTSAISTTNASYESQSETSKCNAVLGSSGDTKNGPFVWSKEIQGHVLGSFFYGYLVSQVPAGMLSERFGAKWVFTASFGICTLMTVLSPVSATFGYGYLIAVRVIAGLASGAAYPSFHVLWSKWAPPMERSKLANICYAGSWMGNVISLPLSGYLCENGFAGGWPSVFYVIGLSSAVWLVFWVIFAADSPSTHWKISTREKEYIVNSLKGQVSDRKDVIPWCSVMKSMPVWAITAACIAMDWGLYTFLTNIPTYMYEVLRFDMSSNGFYSALPFLGMWACMNIAPIVADKIRSTELLSTEVTRKLFTAIGSLGAAGFLIGLSYVDCENPLTAVTLLSFGVAISGTAYTGFFVNHMDIAPQFAGTLLGLSNGIGAVTGFIAPYTVAVLTTNQTQSEWRSVFYVAAGIYVFGALFFLIFAKGDIQDWAKEKVSDEDVELQNKLTGKEDNSAKNGHALLNKSAENA